MRGKAYTGGEGMVRNPLQSGRLRNLPCPCGSDKKAKKCCGKYNFVKAQLATRIKNYGLRVKESGIDNETLRKAIREEKEKAENDKS